MSIDKVVALVVIAFCGILAAALIFRSERDIRLYDKGTIAAAPFSGLPYCIGATYNDGAQVPRSCADTSQLILDPVHIGLTGNNRSRGKQWFRMGDDAVMLYCSDFGGDCVAYSIHRRKFGRSSDTHLSSK